MSERFDGSESRVTFSPWTASFQAGFIRAAPFPSDQLKLFSASAVERNRVAFSLDTFFWQNKRKYLDKGEIFAKRCNRRGKNDADNKAIRRIKSANRSKLTLARLDDYSQPARGLA